MEVCAAAVAGRGLVDPHEPVFAADDEALLRGRSVFETARGYGGRPFLLDEHLARFARSSESVRLPPPDAAECKRLAELVVGACDETELALRLYWTGRTLVATAGPIGPEIEALRARGLRLAAAPWSTGALASAKSTSYAENIFAQQEAADAGAGDALLVASDDTILEAPTSNVWFRERDRLFTPSLDLPVLAGVTRATLLEVAPELGYEVEEGAYPLARLLESDEAFLTSSVREVVPVVVVDGRAVGGGSPGAAAAALQLGLRAAAGYSAPDE